MKPDVGSESRFLPTTPAFDAPVIGNAMPFGTENPKWWIYPTVKQF